MRLLCGSMVKNSPVNTGNEGDIGSIPGLGRSAGEGNDNHSSILAWRIPWTVEPSGLQYMESLKSQRWLSMHAQVLCARCYTRCFKWIWTSLVAQRAKNLSACKRPGFDSWVRKIPWRREWLSTPVFLHGEFHGQRSRKESDATEWLTHSLSLSQSYVVIWLNSNQRKPEGSTVATSRLGSLKVPWSSMFSFCPLPCSRLSAHYLI